MGMIKTLPISGKRLSDDAILAAFDQALMKAAAFVGATSPNPPVGCALLDCHGNILAVATHEKAGSAHAEAAAIAMAGEHGLMKRIHTVVVTLEPCNHYGRTPPCTDAILSTPASFIVIGSTDPNLHVTGGGAARLAEAGLDVAFLEDLPGADAHNAARACKRLIAPFAKRTGAGLPWVTVKQALDEHGSMIPPAGHKTFTSSASLKLAHRLRRRSDAILTGSGTVLADAPSFTVRHVEDFPGKRRFLAVLDRRGRVDEHYYMFSRSHGFNPVSPLSVPDALRHFGRAGALEVLVEAGPELTAHVLTSGLWDEHVLIAKAEAANDCDAVTVRYRDPFMESLKETAWPLGDDK